PESLRVRRLRIVAGRVVLRAPSRVAENLERVRNASESLGIASRVGMMRFRQMAIGLLDLIGRRILWHAQDLVEIAHGGVRISAQRSGSPPLPGMAHRRRHARSTGRGGARLLLRLL